MTLDELVEAVLSVSMLSEDEARVAIQVPVEEAGLDSLDLELLRAAIEKRRGDKIPEDVWQRSKSLAELLESL